MLYTVPMPRYQRQVRRNLEDTDRPASDYPTPALGSDEAIEKPHSKKRWLKWLLLTLLTLILLGTAAAGLGYLFVKKTPLRGEASGRVNILLAGVDDAAKLSDTLMIVSIDTKSKDKKAAMISIPRDLYVKIPGYGSNKINAAYSLGENKDNGEEGGGIALTKKTIESTFDITIHYYATLDFTGFQEAINDIGGVDVEVKTAIDDPFYPAPGYRGYEPFSIEAGPQHLDGETALAYARSRETTTDFDRAARQQQIILAVKNKVLSTDVILDGNKTSKLRKVVDEHVHTDFSNREALKLADMWRNIPDASITRHVIDSSNFLVASQRYGYALIPEAGANDFSEINEFIKNIFSQTANNLPKNQE